MLTENFFVAGPPVRQAGFFGRAALLEEVLRNIQHQPILLIGQRRIGKSSMLQRIEYLLNNREKRDLATIRIDAQWFAGEPSPLHGFEPFVSIILREFREWAERNAPHIDMPREPARPFTVRFVEEMIQALRDNGVHPLLMIDEVDAFSQPYRIRLRGLMNETGLSVLAASFRNPAYEESEDIGGSAWWNLFSQKYVSIFEDHEAREMLVTLSDQSGREFTDADCSLLIDMLGRFPFFLQCAGRKIFDTSAYVVRGTPDTLKSGLVHAAFELLPHFHYAFRHFSERQKEILFEIVEERSVSDDAQIQELVARGVLLRTNGNDLSLFSSLFATYVRQIAEVKRTNRPDATAEKSKWWDVAIEVAGKAIGTALEKTIEMAAGRYS
jgi:hypothetical protein